MICAFCRSEVDSTVADFIAIMDGDCPTGCDDVFILHVSCPNCEKPLFRKSVMQSYIASEQFPAFVKRIKWEEIKTDDDDEFSIETTPDGEEIILCRRDGIELLRIKNSKWGAEPGSAAGVRGSPSSS